MRVTAQLSSALDVRMYFADPWGASPPIPLTLSSHAAFALVIITRL